MLRGCFSRCDLGVRRCVYNPFLPVGSGVRVAAKFVGLYIAEIVPAGSGSPSASGCRRAEEHSPVVVAGYARKESR